MTSRAIYVALGLLCAGTLLWVTMARTDIEEIETALTSANPVWIALGMAAYAANLVVRGVRWRLILRQVAAIGFQPVLTALLVGYGVNTIIPARLGELFRAEFCKQRCGLPRIWALASILIERLLDGIMVIICLGVGLLISDGSSEIGRVLGGVLAIAAAMFGSLLFAALVLSGKSVPRWFDRWPRISGNMEMVRTGLNIVRSRSFPIMVAMSFAVYLPDILSIWLAVRAVGITLGLGNLLVLTGAASLATLLPAGPAFLGTLQLAYALTMQFIGEPAAVGVAATFLVQACYYLPVAIIAVVLIAGNTGQTLRTLLGPRTPS
jgi:glycosyltransferase 2 family protein